MTAVNVSISVQTGGDPYLRFTGPGREDRPENTDDAGQDAAGRP
jgi:hypothetical protein